MLKLALIIYAGIFVASLSAQTITPPSAGDGSSGNPYQISSLANLNWIADSADFKGDWSGKYFIQTQDINASATSGAGYNGGNGFKSILIFDGSYDGQGHIVDSLYMNNSNPGGYDQALFGVLEAEDTIKNLGVTNVNITGYDFVAALIAETGYNGGSSGSVILNCYSTGKISATYGDAGGLVGGNYDTIGTSYSTCAVTGGSNYSFGGLVGYNLGGTIQNCYATGEATGSNAVGGLVGNNSASSTITNCYSLGKIASGSTKGGLVGAIYGGTVSNSFWNSDSTSTGVGQEGGSDNSAGKTSAELQTLSTFTNAGWDFVLETANGTNDYWDMDTTNKVINNGYPFLSWQNDNNVVLPVELSSFTISTDQLDAELRWTTATEANTNGWEVERENGSSSWSDVGFVKGAGISSSLKQYSFVDQNLSPGSYSYRLKQIDNNGSAQYSKSVSLEVGAVPAIFTLSQNYPNPFNPTTTISFTLQRDGRAVLKVYDILGREVATLLDENRKAGEYQQVMFDGSRFSSGVYFAVLQSGGKQLIKTMLLMK
jgi:Secretion system C-terminal sorting domain/The GLUG motif